MKQFAATLIVLFMLGSADVAFAQKREPDPVWEYSTQDAAMEGARANAQRTYPQFLAEFRAAAPAERENYMVKVGLDRAGSGLEHIWVDNLRFEGAELVGDLANEPVYLPGMRRGSRVVIEAERISDWSIMTAEGMYGNFTTRVMLPDIDPPTAAQLRQMLTPNPIPYDWSS